MESWRKSPTLVRAVPFLIFVALTACQGQFGPESRFWFYLLKTLAGAALIWAIKPFVIEMHWSWSWDALVIGVTVFAIWVGLDGLYPSTDSILKTVLCPALKPLGFDSWCSSATPQPPPWNPHLHFNPILAWVMVGVRVVGSSLVVPPLEEIFYRSFLYRYLARPDFEKLPLNTLAWSPLLITAAIFGFSHYEWLPGILCGILYQALVLRHNRLGDAMTAHAITNFMLGLWVIWKGAWHFW